MRKLFFLHPDGTGNAYFFDVPQVKEHHLSN